MRGHRLFATATVAVAALIASPAGAAPAATTIDTLNATASGTTVSVSGTSTLGGEDLQVGADAANDNLGGANGSAQGLDVVAARIGQVAPGAQALQFTFKLGGMQSGGIPEFVSYDWSIKVDGTVWGLKAMRSRTLVTGNTNPYAALFTCTAVGGGASQCTQNQLLPVVFDTATAEIRITLPMDSVGASPGSVIAQGATNPVAVSGTTFGSVSATGLFDVMSSHASYTVPSATARGGIAPVGGTISYTTPLSIGSNGGFSGTLTAAGPGTYSVGTLVCFGGNCATRTTTVTV